MDLFLPHLVLLAAGIVNAAYLHWQYLKYMSDARPMTCPLGGKCADVVASPYGTTWGVKNERWGLAYYFLIFILTFTYVWQPSLALFLKIAILSISGVAVIFSTYLVVIQFSVLRAYCSWCIAATVINYLIFASELVLLL